MTLSQHHGVALVGATLTSAIALTGAVVGGVTGHELSLPAAGTGAVLAAGLVHGLTYAALGWVLVRERHRFGRANRFARAVRPVLLASLAALAAGFVLVAPFVELASPPAAGALATAWGWVASAGFAGMIISSAALGVAVLRTNPLGLGGRVLLLLVPVLAVTVLLGALGSSWAHPGYVETSLHFGVALVGVRAAAGATRPAQPVHAAGGSS